MNRYLNFSIQQILLLQKHHITPIFVFDGAPVPAKADTQAMRNRKRNMWKVRALTSRKSNEADEKAKRSFTQAISVTNEMKLRLINVLREMNVQYLVAPYEADAQLAFLSRMKIVDAVISEDSDCIAYGCRTILFKWSGDGWASELNKRSLGANEDLCFVKWTEEMFVVFCALCGCDYCPSLPGIGPITAYKYVNTFITAPDILEELKRSDKNHLPQEYDQKLYSAVITYRHHLVFDPRKEKLRLLNALDQSKEIVALLGSDLRFLGDVTMRHEVAASIAKAIIHPITHETYSWLDVSRQEEEATKFGQEVSIQSFSPHSAEGSVGGVTTESENEVPPVREDPMENTTGNSYSSEVSPNLPQKQKSESRFQPVLDSLLGSSAHILDFRSPKVSDNFHSLVSTTSISQSYRPDANMDIKQYESKSIRTLSKSSCNHLKRTEHGSKSGFAGEVLCRINQSSIKHLPAKDEIAEPSAKRLCAHNNSSSSTYPQQTRIDDALKREELLDMKTNSLTEWQECRPPSPEFKAVGVEEKWDRILCVDEEN
uniref:Exonuclease 1 n=1 Tax=Albugo laibachii Nc14 TaxID=890382 RepID=F0WSY1_9STRA|nr:exonuclease 1 putative [Albugo laibachii Nc14]|eukprot:CCA24465.1 exonuclease 1 putative [Albugo laibachii Nc14]